MITKLGAAIGASAWLAASFAAAQPATDDAWMGPYVGVSAGVNLGHGKWTATSTSDAAASTAIIDASSPQTFKPTGARGAIFAGYNWRIGRFVMGPEIEVGLANTGETKAGLPGCAIDCASAPVRASTPAPWPSAGTPACAAGWAISWPRSCSSTPPAARPGDTSASRVCARPT